MEFNMISAVVITLEGLLIVFSVLVIIMAVLYALRLFAKNDAPSAGKAPKTPVREVRPVQISDVDVDAMDENEKVAIFSAALAAYLNEPVSGISIASYKKIS